MRTLEVNVVFTNESDVDVLRSIVLDAYSALRVSVPDGRVSMSAVLGERAAKFKRVMGADASDADADVFSAQIKAAVAGVAPSVVIVWTQTFKDDDVAS